MEVLTILYKSALPIDQVLALFSQRAHRYREVPGLRQKLYVHDELSGHVGGIYIFDSREDLDAFLNSDLATSISDAYRFVETATKRILNVVQVLHEEKQHANI